MRPFWKPLDVPEVITEDEDHSISIKYFILQPMFFIRIFSNRGWKNGPEIFGVPRDVTSVLGLVDY